MSKTDEQSICALKQTELLLSDTANAIVIAVLAVKTAFLLSIHLVQLTQI